MTSAKPTIPHEMRAWAGGDSAPADWDGGPVQMRAKDITCVTPTDLGWWHGLSASSYDIVAYTPRTPEPTGDTREQVAREVLARHHNKTQGFHAGTDILPQWAVAAMLEFAALPPARDAEVDMERIAKLMAEAEGWRWGASEGPTNMVDACGSGQDSSRSRETWRKRARAALSASDGKEGVS